ncbi:MAG TPA: S41 family peptidase [Candidatus Polarisedimenticolaceae bacterium]|nr:S41 family peptidase [Candidatus Polarisedimenticolaceae bacterium]
MLRVALVTFAAWWAVSAPGPPPQAARGEIENVAAFARLYGVVRYFYPADAVTSVDWDRYAVVGVSRVRGAKNDAALEASLEELFDPLGPGLRIGKRLPPAPPAGAIDPALVVWSYQGPGIERSTERSPYSARRTHRATESQGAKAFVTMGQKVPAEALRGKTIRLQGRARVTDPTAAGWARFTLRVERPNKQVGFYDAMQDRPIGKAEWTEYVIEGPVADDATSISIGVLANGKVTADFDAVELSVLEGETGVPVPIRDAGFEEPGDAAEGGWDSWSERHQAVKITGDAAEGQRFLRLLPSASAELPTNTEAAAGAHIDVKLGKSLSARVPLALSDEEARLASAQSIQAATSTMGDVKGRSDLDVRLADVVVAWNVFRHFYPYWEEAGVDWDSRLVPQLEIAYAAETGEAQRRVLQKLVADVRDGHGMVTDPALEAAGALPIKLRVLDGKLVVFATSLLDQAPVGAVVTTIDGVAAAQRLEAETQLASGTDQWRAWRATRAITECRGNATTQVALVTPRGKKRQLALPCGRKGPDELRPDPVTELASGTWYVDLTRAKMAEIEPVLPTLATAKGVVFDLRGYPTDAGAGMLPYLLAEAENDRWMHVASITGPFGQVSGWESFGWNLDPATPRLAGQRVFLTDGRAISYAESVMGYVKDRHLATILGGTTAGTNGNVVGFTVPGGCSIRFTGMRVTGHDGRTPHHLAGVRPDIPMEPTIAGIGERRDELLERATELIRERTAPAATARK